MNSTDAALRDRATHTGAQPVSSITGLVDRLAAAPYVAYFDSVSRAFPPDPDPRPAKVTYDATKDLTFDRETEAPNLTSHPGLDDGDDLLFFYVAEAP